ncbi:MAG: hypothetical protein LUC17_02060 [Oscillospiraceae bacterium]|nr:hypothetical protein [Oscillospiraceae bacterium]
MYDVTIYHNTGFNKVNIPDSPSLLTSFSHTNLQSTDLMQNRWISAIAVAANYETLEDVDYCQISSMFYFVDGVEMTSPDVGVLSLTPDFITSAGGPAALTFLDGITERHHVTDDTFGLYTEDDPLLIPSNPLTIADGGYQFSDNSDNYVFMEASIDVPKLGDATDGNVYTATYNDPETGEIQTTEVTVPKVPALEAYRYTLAGMYDPDNLKQVRVPGTAFFDPSNAAVVEGIARARELGVESAIISQWLIPGSAVSNYGETDEGFVGSLTGAKTEASVNLPYIYATVKNNRLLYGDLNKYVIVSIASGNSAEFKPEDIYNNDTAPVVVMITDPRPEGNPYFRFKYYLKSSSNFFANCIKGMTWQSAPLVWTNKSGSEIDVTKFTTDMQLKRREASYNVLSAYGAEGGSGATGAAKTLGAAVNRGVTGLLGAGVEFVTGLFGNPQDTQNMQNVTQFLERGDIDKIKGDFAASAYQELQNLGLGNSVIAPEISFPRNEGIRDFVGNGIYVYRYRPTDADISKLDKVLTMYGYKHTAPLEASFFTNRTYFNYVKADGVTVGNTSLPMWMKEGIAAQFSAGIRFWHVQPNPEYYTNNPVR